MKIYPKLTKWFTYFDIILQGMLLFSFLKQFHVSISLSNGDGLLENPQRPTDQTQKK